MLKHLIYSHETTNIQMQKQTKITTPLIQTKASHQNPNYTNTEPRQRLQQKK